MEESRHITIKLKDEVAKEFDVTGTKVHKFATGKFGNVDLNELSLKQAQALVARGFPYLKPKKVQDDKKGK